MKQMHSTKQQVNDRLVYLDYARFFGMFLVVYGHVVHGFLETSRMQDMLAKSIYQFHMPLFFVLSGFGVSLKKHMGPLKGELINNIKRLFIPYVLWSITYIIFTVKHDALNSLHAKKIFKERLGAAVSLRGIAPIWFLAALFLSKCLLNIFIAKLNKDASVKRTVLALILFVIASFTAFYIRRHITLVKSLKAYLIVAFFRIWPTTFFVFLGYLLGRVREKLEKYAFAIFPISGIIFGSVCYISNNTVNIHTFYCKSMAMFLITGTFGSLMLICACMCLPKCLPIKKMGQASMDIMGLHYPPLPIYYFVVKAVNRVYAGMPAIGVTIALYMVCFLIHCIVFQPIRRLIHKIGNN